MLNEYFSNTNMSSNVDRHSNRETSRVVVTDQRHGSVMTPFSRTRETIREEDPHDVKLDGRVFEMDDLDTI